MKVEEVLVTQEEMNGIELTDVFFKRKYHNIKLGNLHSFLKKLSHEELREEYLYSKYKTEEWVDSFYSTVKYIFIDKETAVREEVAKPFVSGNFYSKDKSLKFIDTFAYYDIKSGYRGVIFFDNGTPVELRQLIRGELKTVIKIK